LQKISRRAGRKPLKSRIEITNPMIARIQIKGNAAEVLVDEVDTISLKEQKKWFASPEWRTFDKVYHINGIINTDKPTIILMDKGNEFMSYKMKTFWDGYYRYSYVSKRRSAADKYAVMAIENAKGIVFDSGDFECPDNQQWGHLYFDITRVIGFDSSKQEKLDLELITAVYLSKEQFEAGTPLPNVAQPEKKKTPKLIVDQYDPINHQDFDLTILKPSWA
jgi:hypothetical protein